MKQTSLYFAGSVARRCSNRKYLLDMRKLHGNRTRCKKKFTWTDNTLKGKKKVGKLTHPMLPFTIHDTIIEWQCYALNIQNNLIFKRT